MVWECRTNPLIYIKFMFTTMSYEEPKFAHAEEEFRESREKVVEGLNTEAGLDWLCARHTVGSTHRADERNWYSILKTIQYGERETTQQDWSCHHACA